MCIFDTLNMKHGAVRINIKCFQLKNSEILYWAEQCNKQYVIRKVPIGDFFPLSVIKHMTWLGSDGY